MCVVCVWCVCGVCVGGGGGLRGDGRIWGVLKLTRTGSLTQDDSIVVDVYGYGYEDDDGYW